MIPITEISLLSPELLGIVATLLSFAFGILARQPAYQNIKSKFSLSKEFVTQIDDALYDDKVTEEEFRKIFDAGKKLIDRGETP